MASARVRQLAEISSGPSLCLGGGAGSFFSVNSSDGAAGVGSDCCPGTDPPERMPAKHTHVATHNFILFALVVVVDPTPDRHTEAAWP